MNNIIDIIIHERKMPLLCIHFQIWWGIKAVEDSLEKKSYEIKELLFVHKTSFQGYTKSKAFFW